MKILKSEEYWFEYMGVLTKKRSTAIITLIKNIVVLFFAGLFITIFNILKKKSDNSHVRRFTGLLINTYF